MFGRVFMAGEDGATAQKVVLLTYDYWLRISGNPKIIGQGLIIGNEKHTIIGVLPPDFTLSVRDAGLCVPSPLPPDRIVARLKAGVSLAQAQAEVVSILRGLPSQSPGVIHDGQVHVRLLTDAFVPGSTPTVLLLQTALLLVLLITCANVGNLLLVRANSRHREFAIRVAIGAGRWQTFRQLMTEGALLAFGGCAGGLLLALMSLGLIESRLPGNIARRLRGAEALAIDHRVLAFTLAISCAAVLFFALAPFLIAWRLDIMSQLRDSARGCVPARQRFAQALVVLEVALALMLLIGTGLTLKSLAQLANANLGFSADPVLRAAVDLTSSRYPTPAQKGQVYTEMVRRLETLPGVESVGLVAPQLFPFGGERVRGSLFQIAGRPDIEPRTEVYVANAAYFRAVRIPLLKGRMFEPGDNAESAPVALISEIVANRYWKLDDPVGRRIRLNADRPDSPWVTIIGIVGDIRNPLALQAQPTAYRPLAQSPLPGAVLMIRVAADPLTLANPVRNQLLGIDPTLPEFRFADLGKEVADYITPQRFTTSVLGFFAMLGLLLAAVGVYGVMRYWVSMRVPEIGVRMALGAGKGDVFRLVLGRAARLSSIGTGIGIAGALALQRFIASQLYGVSPFDPAVFAVVSATMALVALFAAWLPARFAATIDPVQALRSE
jgi:putative ABC transport system permease protein